MNYAKEIQRLKDKGFPKERIREYYLANGYTPEEVEEIMRMV